jgi:hypothetical protein
MKEFDQKRSAIMDSNLSDDEKQSSLMQLYKGYGIPMPGVGKKGKEAPLPPIAKRGGLLKVAARRFGRGQERAGVGLQKAGEFMFGEEGETTEKLAPLEHQIQHAMDRGASPVSIIEGLKKVKGPVAEAKKHMGEMGINVDKTYKVLDERVPDLLKTSSGIDDVINKLKAEGISEDDAIDYLQKKAGNKVNVRRVYESFM